MCQVSVVSCGESRVLLNFNFFGIRASCGILGTHVFDSPATLSRPLGLSVTANTKTSTLPQVFVPEERTILGCYKRAPCWSFALDVPHSCVGIVILKNSSLRKIQLRKHVYAIWWGALDKVDPFVKSIYFRFFFSRDCSPFQQRKASANFRVWGPPSIGSLD